ncbi:MAG: D-aminoacyl-tRNA deacylase [Erysipelotrichaceae bacterium]|nr:D-aminoacyl-tRNA deacylase [Erysipelotrichaceae bacterium]
MRLVIQRVSEASCTVDGVVTGEIKTGFMVLVGIGLDDNVEIVEKMANKFAKLRVFEDEQGKMNLALKDVGGDVLSISQFTLYADCSKGNRPSFNLAMRGEDATKLYEHFNECLRSLGLKVEIGIFGADMKIRLLNDGPVTIIMDSERI